MPDLLDVIDAIVRADQGRAAIVGTIAIVVRSTARSRVWFARFDGRSAICGFAAAVPTDARAAMVFAESEAEAIVRGRDPKIAEDRAIGAGDRALMDGFVARYLGAKSSIDIRAAGSGRTRE